jgi:flagellar basal-body rod protein FlgG
MIRSLYTGATGMKANQTYVDNISHNLANVNTVGYKKSKVEFEDLIYQNLSHPGAENADGLRRPVGLQIGMGSRVVANEKIFMQGSLEQTGRELDSAIRGDGFFQIRMPSGETGYTRNGSFEISSEGYLTTKQGYLVEPNIVVPEVIESLTISPEGIVAVKIPGEDIMQEIGEIELARFINPAGLMAQGGNLYMATEASGIPLVDAPGTDGLGSLQNQYLEKSNVEMVEEMVNMIIAQRGYEISSKSISTSDEMLQTAAGLKR